MVRRRSQSTAIDRVVLAYKTHVFTTLFNQIEIAHEQGVGRRVRVITSVISNATRFAAYRSIASQANLSGRVRQRRILLQRENRGVAAGPIRG